MVDLDVNKQKTTDAENHIENPTDDKAKTEEEAKCVPAWVI